MRIVMIGASGMAVEVARLLVQDGHEVVVIEANQDRIDEVSEIVQCGFLHGDGSRPAILREASAEHTDVLICLSDADQDNIIAALVGRALEFQRVIVRISDADYQSICSEVGLDDVFLPDAEIARSLVTLIETKQNVGRTAMLGDGLRDRCPRAFERIGQSGALEDDDRQDLLAAIDGLIAELQPVLEASN